MIIIKNYFQGIPMELEEAAIIDGSNDLITFVRIILPLSAPVLASVGFRVVVYDNRPDFAKPDHYPSAEQVILGDYLDIGAHLTLTENDYVCIMTPGHQADREVLLQALRSPATYIGCIGSRHKIAATNAYLMANGIPEADLSRVHAPIGLEIYGQTPAEIAVSVAAEMIRHRALRAGTDKKPSKG